MKVGLIIRLLFVALLISGCKANKTAGLENKERKMPNKVEVKRIDGKYRLCVNEKLFYVKGAGCDFGNLESLAQHGANSLRTWTSEGYCKSGLEMLDEAEKHGLLVFMGLGLGTERHGFDYNDSVWVKSQFEEIKKTVIKYKDHPALLGWGLGNELNLFYSNKKVWNAVNDIAKMIHEVDGNHPCTTMLAGIQKDDLDYIKLHCSHLDFVSFQLYGNIDKLDQFLVDAEYDGAYLITEWGPNGHWEVEKTEWGAPIEQTSTEKARVIKRRYENLILRDSINCMGAYVFLWGQKQERTPTWYGLFTEQGEEMETVDVMHFLWNQKWPANRTPQITSGTIDGKNSYENITLESDIEVLAKICFADPDNDNVELFVEIIKESTDLKVGGDYESRPHSISDGIVSDKVGNILFKTPTEKGEYRLLVYVRDGQNHAGTINIPFKVI